MFNTTFARRAIMLPQSLAIEIAGKLVGLHSAHVLRSWTNALFYMPIVQWVCIINFPKLIYGSYKYMYIQYGGTGRYIVSQCRLEIGKQLHSFTLSI